MIKKSLVSFVAVVGLFVGCGSDSSSRESVDNDEDLKVEITKIVEVSEYCNLADKTIISLETNNTSDLVNLGVSYTNGCEASNYTTEPNGITIKSLSNNSDEVEFIFLSDTNYDANTTPTLPNYVVLKDSSNNELVSIKYSDYYFSGEFYLEVEDTQYKGNLPSSAKTEIITIDEI
ncbi:MAG: hypothetical protein U9O56_06125 [Campylobacterota bacterium]|nr:hypothetical protein [Campylobacterota bacterium]